MATGNIPASMMKPIPRRITANITSVKVKPRRERGTREDHGHRSTAAHATPSCRSFEVISFTSDQRAVVSIDDERNRILVQPGFFLRFLANIIGQRAFGDVPAAAGHLRVNVVETLALECFGVEQNQAESGLWKRNRRRLARDNSKGWAGSR